MGWKPKDEFADRILEVLKERGITDYVLLWKDPDSPSVFRAVRGDLLWIEGLMQATVREIQFENDVMMGGDSEDSNSK